MKIYHILVVSNIRSEIKIPIIIFSASEYYYSKCFILTYKTTTNVIIDKMVDI